jgi:hypothetical protein
MPGCELGDVGKAPLQKERVCCRLLSFLYLHCSCFYNPFPVQEKQIKEHPDVFPDRVKAMRGNEANVQGTISTARRYPSWA